MLHSDAPPSRRTPTTKKTPFHHWSTRGKSPPIIELLALQTNKQKRDRKTRTHYHRCRVPLPYEKNTLLIVKVLHLTKTGLASTCLVSRSARRRGADRINLRRARCGNGWREITKKEEAHRNKNERGYTSGDQSMTSLGVQEAHITIIVLVYYCTAVVACVVILHVTPGTELACVLHRHTRGLRNENLPIAAPSATGSSAQPSASQKRQQDPGERQRTLALAPRLPRT